MRTTAVLLATLLSGAFLLSCDLIETATGGGSSIAKDDYEPNDQRNTAAAISLNSDINGTIHVPADVDYFTFTTQNSDNWDWIKSTITNVSGMSAQLTLYNSNGEEVARANSANEGSDVSQLLATTGGTYYAKINSYFSNDSGSYTFSVSNLDTNDIYEPNETRTAAYTLGSLPVSSINGRLLSGSEQDWYKFTTENDGVWDWVKFDITNVSNSLTAQLSVFNSQGTEVFSSNAATNGADLSHSMATTGGTFYAKINSYFANDTGSYSLSIHNLDTNDTYEPNESRDSARNLGTLPVSSVNGRILSGSEQDWYEFTTENKGIWDWVEFDITRVSSGLSAELAVYDSTKSEIFKTNSANEGASFSHRMTSPGGTYYVKINSYFSEDHGSYTLGIRNLDTNDVYEYNDIQDSAHTITSVPSNTMACAIVGGNDEDWFSCPINAGETLQFSVSNSSQDLAVQIEFFDAQGESLGSSNGDKGADLAPTFTNSGSDNGTVYFKIASYYSNGYGDYELSVTAQ